MSNIVKFDNLNIVGIHFIDADKMKIVFKNTDGELLQSIVTPHPNGNAELFLAHLRATCHIIQKSNSEATATVVEG